VKTFIFLLFCIPFLAEPINLEELDYSFTKEPFIHPKIIKDLSTYLSDSGDQVVGINLKDSQNSNRYYGEIHTRELEGGGTSVYWDESGVMAIERSDGEIVTFKTREGFEYTYVGKTDSGIHVLVVTDWGGRDWKIHKSDVSDY